MSRPQARRAHQLAERAGLTEEHLASLVGRRVRHLGRGAATQSGTGHNAAEVYVLADEARAALGGYARKYLLRRPTGFVYVCDCPEPTAPTRPAVIADPFGGTGRPLSSLMLLVDGDQSISAAGIGSRRGAPVTPVSAPGLSASRSPRRSPRTNSRSMTWRRRDPRSPGLCPPVPLVGADPGRRLRRGLPRGRSCVPAPGPCSRPAPAAAVCGPVARASREPVPAASPASPGVPDPRVGGPGAPAVPVSVPPAVEPVAVPDLGDGPGALEHLSVAEPQHDRPV